MPAPRRRAALTEGPVGPLLFNTTLPLALALAAMFAVQLAETWLVGLLGREALAIAFSDHLKSVNLMAGNLTAQVRNIFDQSFAASITSGGPGGGYRYIIPREADRYYGITGRVNF